MPSISSLYKQVYTLLNSAWFIVSSIYILDSSWSFEFKYSYFESFQEFVANEVIHGSWVHENLSFGHQMQRFQRSWDLYWFVLARENNLQFYF